MCFNEFQSEISEKMQYPHKSLNENFLISVNIILIK